MEVKAGLVAPQDELYCTETDVVTEPIAEQVRPVLRPLFATICPIAGVTGVLEGGAALIAVGVADPRSRMVPLVSTSPGVICAMAASTLWGALPLHVPEQGLGFDAILCGLKAIAGGVLLTSHWLSTRPGC